MYALLTISDFVTLNPNENPNLQILYKKFDIIMATTTHHFKKKSIQVFYFFDVSIYNLTPFTSCMYLSWHSNKDYYYESTKFD